MLIILHITSPPSEGKNTSDTAQKNCSPKIVYQFTIPSKSYVECPIPHTLAKAIVINPNFCRLIRGENLIHLLMWMPFCFVCFGGGGYISLRTIKFVYLNIEPRGYHLHEINWLLKEKKHENNNNYIHSQYFWIKPNCMTPGASYLCEWNSLELYSTQPTELSVGPRTRYRLTNGKGRFRPTIRPTQCPLVVENSVDNYKGLARELQHWQN